MTAPMTREELPADEAESRLPLQYEDGPDYCTVTDNQDRPFAMTVQPDLLKAMERALYEEMRALSRKPEDMVELLRTMPSSLNDACRTMDEAAALIERFTGLAQGPAFTIDLRSALQLLDSLDRIAEDFRKVQPCRHNNDNVISELKIELAGLREVLATPQQSPRLEREGIALALINETRTFHGLDVIEWDFPALSTSNKTRALRQADAILALLSPDTTVVSSTNRGEV